MRCLNGICWRRVNHNAHGTSSFVVWLDTMFIEMCCLIDALSTLLTLGRYNLTLRSWALFYWPDAVREGDERLRDAFKKEFKTW